MHGFVCVAVLGILPCRRALGSSAHIDTPFATDTQAADAIAHGVIGFQCRVVVSRGGGDVYAFGSERTQWHGCGYNHVYDTRLHGQGQQEHRTNTSRRTCM